MFFGVSFGVGAILFVSLFERLLLLVLMGLLLNSNREVRRMIGFCASEFFYLHIFCIPKTCRPVLIILDENVHCIKFS